eukprot:gene14771-biopygen2784
MPPAPSLPPAPLLRPTLPPAPSLPPALPPEPLAPMTTLPVLQFRPFQKSSSKDEDHDEAGIVPVWKDNFLRSKQEEMVFPSTGDIVPVRPILPSPEAYLHSPKHTLAANLAATMALAAKMALAAQSGGINGAGGKARLQSWRQQWRWRHMSGGIDGAGGKVGGVNGAGGITATGRH